MRRLILSLLLLPAAAQALQVIDMHWRDAADVATALRPQLQAGEKVSSLGNQLVIDAPPAREGQLIALAQQLDVRPASLNMEISMAGRRSGDDSNLRIGGGVTIGNVTIGSGGRYGAGITIGGSQGSYSTSGNTTQSLRLLDGGSGYIRAVDSRPLPWSMVTPRGTGLRGGTYQDAVTGFYAKPHVVGDRVRLELAVSQEAFSGRDKNGNNLSTTVEGRLGEWIEVGSAARNEQGQETLLIGHANGSSQSSNAIRVKIQTVE